MIKDGSDQTEPGPDPDTAQHCVLARGLAGCEVFRPSADATWSRATTATTSSTEGPEPIFSRANVVTTRSTRATARATFATCYGVDTVFADPSDTVTSNCEDVQIG